MSHWAVSFRQLIVDLVCFTITLHSCNLNHCPAKTRRWQIPSLLSQERYGRKKIFKKWWKEFDAFVQWPSANLICNVSCSCDVSYGSWSSEGLSRNCSWTLATLFLFLRSEAASFNIGRLISSQLFLVFNVPLNAAFFLLLMKDPSILYTVEFYTYISG